VLEEGTRWNWFDDSTIRTGAEIAAGAGLLFVLRSLTFARPVVDLRAFANRNFSLGCLLSFIIGVGIFSTIYLTPLFLGYVRHFSAWQIGAAIFSTVVASLVGVPIYVTLARKFDTRWLMMAGLASFGLAMWSYSFITNDWGGDQFFLPQNSTGLSASLRGRAERHARSRKPRAGAPEIRERAFQHDAQSRWSGRHCRMRRDPQQSNQLPLCHDRLAPDPGKRRDESLRCDGRASLR
jgi:hypothetical protein